jgi:hypothetical protein
MPKAITQHYWGPQPITPAARPRRVEGQAQHLQEYKETQKRARRLQVAAKAEITEQEQIDALVECMDAFGRPVMWAAIIAVLAVLLVQNYGWWIAPGLGSVWVLKKLWPRLWGKVI